MIVFGCIKDFIEESGVLSSQFVRRWFEIGRSRRKGVFPNLSRFVTPIYEALFSCNFRKFNVFEFTWAPLFAAGGLSLLRKVVETFVISWFELLSCFIFSTFVTRSGVKSVRCNLDACRHSSSGQQPLLQLY